MDAIKRIFPTIEIGAGLAGSQAAEAENIHEAEERKFLPEARAVEITDFAFKTEPFWHQKVSFNFARALEQCALFLEQGLGKSKVFIDLATWRFRKGQVRAVLVVCPNSVVGAWAKEIATHGHDDFKGVILLEGSTAKRVKTITEATIKGFTGFYVVNYEGLLGLWDYMLQQQKDGARLFQMIGLDESSRIKHAQSKRSQICWKLGMTVKYRNILTGTPVTQTGEDIFGQYRFLKPQIFGPYATAFRGQYLIMGGFEMRQVIGYRNFPDFLKKVYSVAIRFTKERCLDLPPKVYQTRVVRLDEETSRQYRTFEKECVAEFSGAKIAAPLIMTKIMKLSQVTGGFIYEQGTDGQRVATHTFAKNPKLDDLEEFLEEVRGKKVIVWCRFTQEIEVIRKLLESRAIRYVAIHGQVPVEERSAAVAAFQEDTAVTVFLGQVATAGLGITLTAAEYVYYYSNTYALEDRLQSEDRPHRIGLKHTVVYVDCLAETHDGKRTIDHDVLAVLKGKATFANEVSAALMARMASRHEVASPSVMKNPAHVRAHAKNSDINFEEDAF